MKKFTLGLLFLFPLKSMAFFESLFAQKAGSTAAIANGADDLVSEIDDSSEILKTLKKTSSTFSDVRNILSDVDSTIYDVDYVKSSISDTEDLAGQLHTYSDKVRRAKRIAKTLGIIEMDAPTATAMEVVHTNTILDNYVNDQKEKQISEKENYYKRLVYMAKREQVADKSLSNALTRMKERDQRSGIQFSPFTIPDGKTALNDRIMTAIYESPNNASYGL